MESRSRSLVKAVSWQAVGLVTMSAISFAFTGSLARGGALALASAGVSFFTYLMHERAWAGVTWGRTREPGRNAAKAGGDDVFAA